MDRFPNDRCDDSMVVCDLKEPNLNFALVESPCVDKIEAMYKSAKERGFSFKITAALHTSSLFYLRTY